MTTLSLTAPAKVNLWLRVCGKRPDGYHELETVFHAIDLCDELVAQRTDEDGAVRLEIVGGAGSGLAVAAGDDNLVVRAAQAYRRASGVRHGFRFHLQKRIPAGGGLGGGSSDAAAALRLADALSGDPLGLPGLHTIAASLGSDVPFFLAGGTRIGTGTGTTLHEFDARAGDPMLHFVLLLPSFGTATPRVYENYVAQLHDDAATSSIGSIEARLSQRIRLATGLRNDLEAAATRAYPALGRLMRSVADAGFPEVRVSGSGSTMFLAFTESEAAAHALESLRDLAHTESMALVSAKSAPRMACQRVPWPSSNSPTSSPTSSPSSHG